MRPLTAARSACLAATLVWFATACGGTSGALPVLNPAEQVAANEVAAHFTTGDASFALDTSEAACVATRVVKTLGIATSTALAPDSHVTLDDHQASKAADAINRCVRLRTLIGRTIAAAAPLPQTTVDCMTAKLTDHDLKTILAAQLQGRNAADTPAYTTAAKSMNTCLTAADRNALPTRVPQTSAVPTTLGAPLS